MSFHSEYAGQHRKKKTLQLLSILAILVGVLTVLGWIYDIPALKSVFSGYPPMRFNSALVLVVLGISLYLLINQKLILLLRALCILVVLFGIFCLYEDAANADLGIDEFFVKDNNGLLMGYAPGRPSTTASICFLMMAGGFFLLSTRKEELILIAQYCFHGVTIISLAVILGYILHATSLYGLYFFTSVALNMAAMLFLLSIGTAILNAEKGITSVFTGMKTGNIMARRLFPLMSAFLVLITFLRVLTFKNNWLTEEAGIVIIIILFLLASLLLIGYNTYHLNRLDDKSAVALGELEKTVKDLTDYKYALDKGAIVSFTDTKGIITHVNDNWCKISKYGKEELIGHTHQIVNSGYHGKEFFQNLWSVILRGEIWKGEIRNKAKDGTFFWMDTTIIPLLNAEGKPYQFLGFRSDITKRNEYLEELKTSEEKFRNFFENTTVGMFFTDMKTLKTIDVNETGAKLFGYDSREELLKKFNPYYHLVNPEDRTRNIDIISKENKVINSIQEMKKLDGTHFWIQQYIVLNTKRDIAQTVVIDITEMVKSRNSLIDTIRELEIANKELESFTFISSHDLQEPLRKIKTFCSVLQNEESKLSEEGKYYLKRMYAASERMQNLINDLLSYSRISRSERNFEKADLNKIFQEVVSDFNELVQEKNALIKSEGFCEVRVIRFQIRQLFANLVSNSLKFTAAGRRPEIIIKSRAEQGSRLSNSKLSPQTKYCHIIYSDNGIGFDPRYNEKVFELFERLESEHYPGTGIGLAICKRIVENHGGVILAAGEQDKGVRFDIYLPQL